MANKVYVGESDTARDVNQLYIGVDDIARTVTKAYIGVDGVARLCYEATSPTTTTKNVYGVTWNGTESTLLKRTDLAAAFSDPVPAVGNGTGSSPFDNIMPWSGMVRVTDDTVGELVAIPKYWYRWTKQGANITLQISDHAEDGFHVSPAHANRGDGAGERSVVYVGRYHCNREYKSVSGDIPVAWVEIESSRRSIHAVGGSNIWQYDYAMFWTIKMLYLVEYANWDSQAVIGLGCGNGSGKQAMGYTDDMVYHTGTSQASLDTYGLGTQYRYIEGLWDNVYDWTDGIYLSEDNIYIVKNPANFSNTSNGTPIGAKPTSGGWVTSWVVPTVSGMEWALYPYGIGGSGTTYCADACTYIGDSGENGVFSSGGYYYNSRIWGMFYLGNDNSGSSTTISISDYTGCRLMKLP